jgi:mannose-1-phosphate guanylyltransferase/mannose-1-phosphate guanylyltransferase/mannose-6-phosphate isomerase
MMLAPSDHVIDDVPGFVAAVRTGAPAAAEGRLVTFGITPNRPETGYGYIRRSREIAGGSGVFSVAAFVEKPDRPKAETFLASGEYFWNSGMFLFSPQAYLAELEIYAPNLLAQARKALSNGRRDLDFLRLDRDAFAAADSISIDYAVMERTTKAAVVPADIGWSDVGSWSMLWERGA